MGKIFLQLIVWTQLRKMRMKYYLKKSKIYWTLAVVVIMKSKHWQIKNCLRPTYHYQPSNQKNNGDEFQIIEESIDLTRAVTDAEDTNALADDEIYCHEFMKT